MTRCCDRRSSVCNGATLFATRDSRYGTIFAMKQCLTCSSTSNLSRMASQPTSFPGQRSWRWQDSGWWSGELTGREQCRQSVCLLGHCFSLCNSSIPFGISPPHSHSTWVSCLHWSGRKYFLFVFPSQSRPPHSMFRSGQYDVRCDSRALLGIVCPHASSGQWTITSLHILTMSREAHLLLVTRVRHAGHGFRFPVLRAVLQYVARHSAQK